MTVEFVVGLPPDDAGIMDKVPRHGRWWWLVMGLMLLVGKWMLVVRLIVVRVLG